MVWKVISDRQILEVWLLTDTRDILKISIPELDFELEEPSLSIWKETVRTVHELIGSHYAEVVDVDVDDLMYLKLQLDEIGTRILFDALDYDDQVLEAEVPRIRIPIVSEIVERIFY